MLVCALWSTGCSSEPADATAVVLRLDADPEIKRGTRAMILRIWSERDGKWVKRIERGWESNDGRFVWPAELPIVPLDDTLPRFEVIFEARAADGRNLAGTRAVASFTRGEVTALGLFLKAECYMLPTECEPALDEMSNECHGPTCKTCRAGRCVETRVSSLPSYRADEAVRELFEASIEGRSVGGSGGTAGAAGRR